MKRLLKRLSGRFLLQSVNHGEESEDTGHRQGSRGIGEEGSGVTMKGTPREPAVPRKFGSNNKARIFTFGLVLVICWERVSLLKDRYDGRRLDH